MHRRHAPLLPNQKHVREEWPPVACEGKLPDALPSKLAKVLHKLVTQPNKQRSDSTQSTGLENDTPTLFLQAQRTVASTCAHSARECWGCSLLVSSLPSFSFA